MELLGTNLLFVFFFLRNLIWKNKSQSLNQISALDQLLNFAQIIRNTYLHGNAVMPLQREIGMSVGLSAATENSLTTLLSQSNDPMRRNHSFKENTQSN